MRNRLKRRTIRNTAIGLLFAVLGGGIAPAERTVGDLDESFAGTVEKTDAGTEVTVGSRKIQTGKFTPEGTPVVPMWEVPMPASDLRRGAGFSVLEGKISGQGRINE